eukprot:CFRG1944T1
MDQLHNENFYFVKKHTIMGNLITRDQRLQPLRQLGSILNIAFANTIKPFSICYFFCNDRFTGQHDCNKHEQYYDVRFSTVHLGNNIVYVRKG